MPPAQAGVAIQRWEPRSFPDWATCPEKVISLTPQIDSGRRRAGVPLKFLNSAHGQNAAVANGNGFDLRLLAVDGQDRPAGIQGVGFVGHGVASRIGFV